MELNRPGKDGADVMSVVDLQKFLANELSETESDPTFHRAFTPLTDGLGLESPRKQEAIFNAPELEPEPAPPPESAPEPMAPPAPEPLKVESVIGPPQSKEPKLDLDSEDLPPIDPLLAAKRVPIGFFEEPAKPEPAPVSRVAPPPIPTVGLFRRVFAAILDQGLVLSLWVVSLIITSQILSRGEDALWDRLLRDLSSPTFLNFALMEFAALWLAYYAICLGAMDMTLGMWAWGMRVGYTEGNRGWKKWRRIVLSLGLVAPVVPSLILAIRVRGRNLLDGLSGTSLYRA